MVDGGIDHCFVGGQIHAEVLLKLAADLALRDILRSAVHRISWTVHLRSASLGVPEVNAILGIVENDLVGYEKGLVCVRRAQTEQGESSRQICHGAKHNDTAY